MHHPTDDLDWVYVQAFLTFLGERRALYAPGARLKQSDTIVSVQKIIAKCQVGFEQLHTHSPSALLIQKIADACHRFLAQAESASGIDFYIALGGLRAHLADATSQLSVIYNISSVLPTAALPPGYDNSRLLSE